MSMAPGHLSTSISNSWQTTSRRSPTKVFDSIKGLSVMPLLAATEQDDLDPTKAQEFAVYAAAALCTIERAGTERAR